MKVSVLITTYNLEKYIAGTLDSVLNQKTDFEYEILVGDDGSSDNTVDIVRAYQESNNKIREITTDLDKQIIEHMLSDVSDWIEKRSESMENIINGEAE